ncbi:MAG: DUF3343 domain-containing protein [Oscillospiraceae bacterium]|nr:DUF3343 domain-containing protein [Oscillospiraceae bacterium]
MLDLVLVGSITNAFKAKDILKKNNIKTHIFKISNKEGCGYVVCSPNETNQIIKILKKNNIKILGRFPNDFIIS